MFLKLTFFVLCNLSATLGVVPNSKSFIKCLEYNEVNGKIGDLVPFNLLRSGIQDIIGGGQDVKSEQLPFMKANHQLLLITQDIFAGGQDVKFKQLPFMAALGYGEENLIKYYCGGSLISKRFVLSAAHCIFSRNWGVVKFVRLGDLNLTSAADDDGVQMRRVEEYYIHPNFTYPFKYHDIALIKMDKSVTISPQVLPACLESSRNQLLDSYLYAAGWGAIGHGENQSDHLQIGTLVKYNISECRRTFPKELTLPMGVDDETQICAGAGDSLADTCEGDSGGPLGYSYLLNSKPVHFVIGVTSFGKTCFLAKIPSIYTRVSYYSDWIESTVWPRNVVRGRIIFPSE